MTIQRAVNIVVLFGMLMLMCTLFGGWMGLAIWTIVVVFCVALAKLALRWLEDERCPNCGSTNIVNGAHHSRRCARCSKGF